MATGGERGRGARIEKIRQDAMANDEKLSVLAMQFGTKMARIAIGSHKMYGGVCPGGLPINVQTALTGRGDMYGFGTHNSYRATCFCPGCRERFMSAPEFRSPAWTADRGL